MPSSKSVASMSVSNVRDQGMITRDASRVGFVVLSAIVSPGRVQLTTIWRSFRNRSMIESFTRHPLCPTRMRFKRRSPRNAQSNSVHKTAMDTGISMRGKRGRDYLRRPRHCLPHLRCLATKPVAFQHSARRHWCIDVEGVHHSLSQLPWRDDG